MNENAKSYHRNVQTIDDYIICWWAFGAGVGRFLHFSWERMISISISCELPNTLLTTTATATNLKLEI